MRILLLGANGKTGREVLARALKQGHRVTALVRSEDRLADTRHDALIVKVGNVCDPSVLRPLVPGHDLVISVLGPRRPTKAATAIYHESATAIVDAMRHGKVKRLLLMSSALLFPDDSLSVRALRWLVPNNVQSARRMEEWIIGSELHWTIVRTGFLNTKSETRCRIGRGVLPEGGGAVSRAAVAEFLLSEAVQSAHVKKIVGVCG